jgi:four helix bundle protein
MNRHLRIVAQMEGAVTSIAQNIAEGKGREQLINSIRGKKREEQ